MTAPEYGRKPEHDRAALGALPDDESSRLFDAWREEDRAWRASIYRGLSLGHLTSDQAAALGWHPGGHDTEDGTGRSLWQHLPRDLYHVTTDLPGVRRHGLMTRDELGQQAGLGLGGGGDDTISMTTDRQLAGVILRGLHEFHAVVTGRTTAADLWEQARAGTGAARPYHDGVARYYQSGWQPGDPVPRGLSDVLKGSERYEGVAARTRQEMHDRHGPGWEPADDGWDTVKGRVHAGPWTRSASAEYQAEQRASLYKTFSAWREQAGGPADPLFFSTDVSGFVRLDPAGFALLHVRPVPGAQGYPLRGMSEWRTCCGAALDVHDAEQLQAAPDVAPSPAPDHAADTGWADLALAAAFSDAEAGG